MELRQEILAATGIPEALTNKIVQALKGADRWGSLLKVDKAVDLAVQDYGQMILPAVQGDLFNPVVVQPEFNFDRAKASVLEKLEQFLGRCTRGDDLGLRLRGEQLTAGVRFIRMVQADSYDLVVGNPPYQATSKMDDSQYLMKHYPMGKADLYAAFLERGLQLAKQGGISGLVTMRNWMFISQYSAIREFLIDTYDLRTLGDFDRGAFDEVPNEVLAVTLSIFQKITPGGKVSIALQPTPLEDFSYDRQRTNRKRAAVLIQVGRIEFITSYFRSVDTSPLIYWWSEEFRQKYEKLPLLGSDYLAVSGTSTGSNIRFTRYVWEPSLIQPIKCDRDNEPSYYEHWQPFINGGKGRKWIEPLIEIIDWNNLGLACRNSSASRTLNLDLNWYPGLAFVMIGAEFSARTHRFKSICGNKGSSVFPNNYREIPKILESLNIDL